MSLSNLHLLDDSTGANSDYKTKRFQILSLLEGSVRTPYFDSKGIITIGVGVNIDTLNEDKRFLVMGAGAMNLSSAQQTAINSAWKASGMATIKTMPQATQTQLNAKNAALRTYLDSVLGPSQEFSMTDPQIRFVFDQLITNALTAVSSSISEPSYEQIILISLYHNRPELVGAKLKAAIASDNRAEAWYEIRYGHKNELWDRRYAEAEYFGLYGDMVADPVGEAKSIYRMFTMHRAQMLAADGAHANSIANNVYRNVGTLEEELTDAKVPIISYLNNQNGLALNPEEFSATGIYLDPGRDNPTDQLNLNHGATLDAREFGVGADPDGSIPEIAIRNVLVGEGGKDTLIGGKGNDILLGGADVDTYEFQSGDGDDIIVDPDGTAKLVRNGQKLAFGVKTDAGPWKQTANGVETTYTKVGAGDIADLVITFSDVPSDKITLKNFDFTKALLDYYGLRLVDAPSSPTDELRTFYGDKQDWDSDPNQAGIQTQTDAYGNTIRADGQGSPDPRPDIDEPDREDFFYGSSANEVERFITAGGNDTVYADGPLSITSSAGGEDIVEAGAGSDIVAAGAGDDWVEGGTEDDILGGNDGNDSLFAETSGGGTLTIDLAIAQGESGMQRAGQGDLLSGDAGDDVLFSDAGADYLVGGEGEDIIIGGAGDDTIYGDGTLDAAQLGWSVTRTRTDVGATATFDVSATGISLAQDDALGGLDVIYGGAGDDWIFAGAGDDYVEGGIGNDVLFGEAGNDVLLGGEGNDVLSGDSAAVDAAGLSGDDYLVGGEGDDLIFGGKGNDYLDGGEGFDLLYGGEGDDTLVGGPGGAVLRGGAGKDTYVYDAGDGTQVIDDDVSGPDDPEASVLILGPGISPEDVKFRPDFLVVDLGGGNLIQFLHFDPEDPLATPVLDAIEFQSGGFLTLEDVLEQGFDIDGTEGDDALFGTPYTDRIDARGGNDTVTGRAGDDTILGGAGDDWIEANDGNDVVDGGEGSDQVAGGWGDDILIGGDGDDALAGEGGNDSLDGGAGNDSLVGHDGDDVLNGGTGNDLLVGNEGSDTYTFAGGDGIDLIDEQASIALGVADEAGIDVVRFDASVTPGQVALSRHANGDLTIDYGTGDAITVIGQYTGAAQAIERIEFDDGSFIDKAALDALIRDPLCYEDHL